MFKFNLGEEVQEIVTGFTGIVMTRTEFLTGCVHYAVGYRGLIDGKPIDWEWFDESRLIKIGDGITLVVKREGRSE